MFGKHWEAARGTVAATHVVSTSSDGMVSVSEFAVDVRTASGEVFRTKVEEPRIAIDFKKPAVGTEVRLEFDPGSRKIRFDKDDPAISWKAYKANLNRSFDQALHEQPGTAPSAGGPQVQSWIDAALAGQQTGSMGIPVVRLDRNDPDAAALREMLLRAAGFTDPAAEGHRAPPGPA